MFRLPVDETLELGLLEPYHAPALFGLIDEGRDKLRRWLTWVDTTLTVEDSRRFIHHTLEQFSRCTALTVGVVYDGALAGICGFHAIERTHRSSSIGYWLGSRYEGQGLMTRAVRALTTYAFTTLDLNRLEIRVAVENTRSRAIPERLGFQLEGVRRDGERLYDRFVDLAVYSLLARDWRG
ncbi:GNAT family N-acetyltransferase [Myxococcus sp. NMCA1]|uniref:GNAT family N-acetyltransferase n=1 Tax=Myxococcus sp. NMCA1 TaxID=2996785 RepID=UPI0022858E14|nr:GNAT family protein [Myxococcus sp. NMCA1]WAM29921.1 GNAT family protein [Myxococcus sp. NMCA1]